MLKISGFSLLKSMMASNILPATGYGGYRTKNGIGDSIEEELFIIIWARLATQEMRYYGDQIAGHAYQTEGPGSGQ